MRLGLILITLLQSPWLFADDFSERLEELSTINESNATFIETWSADYLNEPLISKGSLIYIRPGQLSKHITIPEHIEQHIKGDRLSVTHNGETHHIQLSEQPELAAGIYALQAVLDGDQKKLLKLFHLQYSEIKTHWKLTLTPKDDSAKESIETIVLQGKNNKIQRISIQFLNGDRLLTVITHDE